MHIPFTFLSVTLVMWSAAAMNKVEIKIKDCPDKCSCLDNVVNCSNSNLRFLPHVIPATSITLLLQNNKLISTKLSTNLAAAIGKKLWRPIFNPFAKLTYIDLSHNALNYLDGELFDYTDQLKKLILDDNYLKNLRDTRGSFRYLQKLHELSIRNNQINQPLTYSDLSIFYNLTKLDLTNNQIQHINSNAFNNLLLLTELRLGRNRIHSLPSGCFTMLRNLRFLDLSDNKLARIDPGVFGYLPQITNINLSKSEILHSLIEMGWPASRISRDAIRSINGRILVQLEQLKYLNISKNELKEVPSIWSKNLLIIEASDNMFECSCATRKKAKVMRNFENKTCTVDSNYTALYDVKNKECVVCQGVTRIISPTELERVCRNNNIEKLSVTMIAVYTSVTVVIIILLVLISVFIKRRVSKQNNGARQPASGAQNNLRTSNRFSWREWTHRGISRIQTTLKRNYGSDTNATERNAEPQNYYETIERQASLELPNSNKAGEYMNEIYHEIPEIKVTSVKAACAYKHNPGRETCSRISTASIVTECIDINSINNDDYCLPTEQSITTSHSLSKPVPKAGIIMTPTTNRPLSNNNLFIPANNQQKSYPESSPYEIPISNNTDLYMELSSDME